MYSLLVKSISQQNQPSNIISGSSNGTSETRMNCESSSVIAKNNQFLVQLNLMMSQATTAASGATQTNNSNNSQSATLAEVNWFHLLVNLAKHKSTNIIDCMLFSLFCKIAQLTPRLFGSLLGTDVCVNQMHDIVVSKLKASVLGRGQVVSSVCEFLCALVEYQPGYFQSLAALKSDSTSSAVQVDESRSVLKFLFDLLKELKNHKVTISFFLFLNT